MSLSKNAQSRKAKMEKKRNKNSNQLEALYDHNFRPPPKKREKDGTKKMSKDERK